MNNFGLRNLINTDFTPEDVFIEATTSKLTAKDLEDFLDSLSKEKLDELYRAMLGWNRVKKPVSSDELACKTGAEKVSNLISDKFFKNKNFSVYKRIRSIIINK